MVLCPLGERLRIVSLVPSLTHTLFDLGLTSEEIVGRTPWCIHPQPEVEHIHVVGGTKTPNLGKILKLNPTLLVLDKDENPKAVYDWAVEYKIPTFVCDVSHPRDVPAMIIELGAMINCQKRAQYWAQTIEEELDKIQPREHDVVVMPLIWHDPLMGVSPQKYAGGLIEALGFRIPTIESEGTGYPVVTIEQLVEHRVQGLLLSSEPHNFSLREGEDICDEIELLTGYRPWFECIDGEALTWMGTKTADAFETLKKSLSKRLII